MRAAFLVLTLCTGTVAFAQSNSAHPANSFKLELTQPAFTRPAANPSTPHMDLHATNEQLWNSFMISSPRVSKRSDSAQIDPEMTIRPPKSSVGVQPPGTPMAQNLYPYLRLLPIDEPNGKLAPIPTEWPNLILQNIPINWPKYEVRLVKGDTDTP
jgi:hypothetical protein